MWLSSTPYDDVFRTLVNDTSSLLIPYVNEMFQENYTGKEKIHFYLNEHFMNQQNGSEKDIPDNLSVTMETPGGILSYDIKVMKLQMYSLEEIFAKKLYLLIPFYIFTYEANFEEYDNDVEKIKEFKQEFQRIRQKLEGLCEQGEINEFTKRTILDMSNKVIESIAKKHRKLRKEVRSVMCGEVLEYPAKTILRQGIAEGEKRGKILTMIDIINKKLQKGKTVLEIAEELEADEEKIEQLVLLVQKYGFENQERILEKLTESPFAFQVGYAQ